MVPGNRESTDRSVAYYDEIAADYDRQLLERPADRLARQAFQELVGRYVPRASTILDFGCGTGIDAEWYVRNGYDVLAFDQSEQMVARLRDRCRTAMSSGRLKSTVAPFASFESVLNQWPSADALVSNFAVMNMVEDPRRLFEIFARSAKTPAWLMISLVNPMHRRYLARASWWRNTLTRRPGESRFRISTHYDAVAHFPSDLVAAAKGFDLLGVGYAGRYVRYIDLSAAPSRDMWWSLDGAMPSGIERMVWSSPAVRLTAAFVFLVFRTT